MTQSPVVLDSLENDLALLFRPVEPRPVFVESLAVRLRKPKPVQLEKAGKMPLLLVIVGTGLLVGALFYIATRLLRLFIKNI